MLVAYCLVRAGSGARSEACRPRALPGGFRRWWIAVAPGGRTAIHHLCGTPRTVRFVLFVGLWNAAATRWPRRQVHAWANEPPASSLGVLSANDNAKYTQ